VSSIRGGQILLALALVVLSACQADTELELKVNENGSGAVALQVDLDAEAMAVLGDVDAQLRVDDLERAGWDVTSDPDDDGLSIRAEKPVSDSTRWQSVLDEIVGPGVFTNVEVRAANEFAKQSQRISYELDLGDGWSLFSDAEVTAALKGEPFGAPVEVLSEDREIDDIVAVQVTTSVWSDDEGTPSTAVGTPRFDDSAPLTVNLVSTTEQSTAILLRWIAMALFSLFALATVLAVTGIVLQRRSHRLRPSPTPASLASRVPGAQSATTAPSMSATAAPETSVRLVVIDPLAVLYGQPRTLDEALLPFIRKHQGDARADAIETSHHAAAAGTMETDEFWERCGVDIPGSIDGAYLRTRQLQNGVADFLKEMQRRRIPVAAISDDVAEWSHNARERDRLRAIWPWLVSADVGVTKSNPAMFEILRRESGTAYGHCLYVDSDLNALDVARDLGMKTALLDTGNLDLPEVVGHPVVTDFKALIG